MDQFIGVNWQIGASYEGIECAGFVREFHRWTTSQGEAKRLRSSTDPSHIYPDECLNFNPVNFGQEAEIDFFYDHFLGLNLEISPSMTSSLPYYTDNLGGEDPNNPGFAADVLVQETWLPVYWDAEIIEEEYIDADGQTQIRLVTVGDPVPANARLSPESYVPRADWMSQYIARYGRGNFMTNDTKYCDDDENGYENNDGLVNLNKIRYIESWNEPERTWQREEARFSPQEYATMANVDFDGDDGEVDEDNPGAFFSDPSGYRIGVKSVDPNVKFVMGGTFDIQYKVDGTPYQGNINDRITVWEYWIQPMIDWFKTHRDDYAASSRVQLPFDVLNFHHYSTSDATDLSNGKWISPEQDELRRMIKEEIYDEMVDAGWKGNSSAFSQYNKELWISEFGYDTNQLDDNNGWDFGPVNEDPNNPAPIITSGPIYGNLFPEDLQAQWIARSFLEMYAAGVDRAIIHDIESGSSGDIAAWDKHTGLITADGDPKKSWFFVFSMKNLLQGYRFVADESVGNCTLNSSDTACNSDCTRVYRFQNNSGDNIWAVWSPSHCDIPPYSVTFPSMGNTNEYGAMRLGSPSTFGIADNVTISGDELTVMASETPVFILERPISPPACPIVSAVSDCSSAIISIEIPDNTAYHQMGIWYGIDDGTTIDFAALTGNMTQHKYDLEGNTTEVLLTGLSPNTTYRVVVIPHTNSGIPSDGNGNLELCIQEFITENSGAIDDLCKISTTEFTILETIGQSPDPTVTRLFDEQNMGLDCGNSTPVTTWINFNANENKTSEVIITFNERYSINNFLLYNTFGGGVITFEWSNDEVNTVPDMKDWNEMTDYFTFETGWETLTNLHQPAVGVKFLRIRALGDMAKINELFICGRPVCPVGTPTATPTCTDADFTLNASGTECAIASELTIQGNSGIETHPVNRNDFNYPSSFFTERGPNQLIPGVTYNPKVETCSGNNCSTETLNFTVPATGSCVLPNNPISANSRYAGGCGSYTFQVDAGGDDQVQVWLSHSSPFTSTTTHPLEQNPEAEMMVLTVDEGSTLGATTKVITVPYDRCERRFYLAYRYITENESSPLFTLTLATAGNNIAWETVCTCTGPNTPTPFFIIEDCHITDVVYDYLEVGEKLSHRELKTASLSTPQTLKQEVKNITSPDYTYHLTYHEVADRLNFKVSDASPWEMLDLTAVPCLRATNPSGTAAIENEAINQVKPDLKTSLHLYPNPTRHHLNVEITESVDLLLMGIDGKVHNLIDLKTTNYGYQFSTSHLLPGLYLLRTIDAAGNTQTGKFLVQE